MKLNLGVLGVKLKNIILSNNSDNENLNGVGSWIRQGHSQRHCAFANAA